MDVGVIHDGGRRDLALRQRHVLRHRPAHAAQDLRRPGLGEDLGDPFDVGGGDHAIRPGRGHHLELDIELARQRPHRRDRLDGCRAATDRGRCVLLQLVADRDRAHHGAGVAVFAAALEADQRRADMHDLAGLAEQFLDPPLLRRRDIDDGLGRLHRHHLLVGLDFVTDRDVPLDDLRFLQPLAQIRQFEDFHDASMVFLTASTMRATLGRYCDSSRASGTTTS